MKRFLAKYPLAAWMSIGYLIFLGVFLVGYVLNYFNIFGELGDGLSMVFFLWPYPLLLALQNWINPSGYSFLIAYPLGLILVIVFGFYAQRLLKISNSSAYSMAWAILLFPIPLILLQVVVALFVFFILGLPIGE